MIAAFTQNAVYSFTLSFMSGFVFLMLAVFSLINTVLMIIIRYMKQKYDISESSKEVDGDKDISIEVTTVNTGKDNEAVDAEKNKEDVDAEL